MERAAVGSRLRPLAVDAAAAAASLAASRSRAIKPRMSIKMDRNARRASSVACPPVSPPPAASSAIRAASSGVRHRRCERANLSFEFVEFFVLAIFSTAPLTSDLSRCNVCRAMGVVAAAC